MRSFEKLAYFIYLVVLAIGLYFDWETSTFFAYAVFGFILPRFFKKAS